MVAMRQDDVFGISKKALSTAKKRIVGMHPEDVRHALRNYKWFLRNGGKRPKLHDERGRIIISMCPQIVPILERHAALGIEEVTPMPTKSQRCRQFNKAADKANERHDKEATAKRPPPVADEHRFEVVPPSLFEEDDVSVDFIKLAVDTCGSAEVLVKKFRGDRTVVAIFWEGREVPKKREVVEYTPDTEPKNQKAGAGNRQPIANLEEAGWKWGKLAEYPRVIEHVAKESFSSGGKKAA